MMERGPGSKQGKPDGLKERDRACAGFAWLT
jgi:hypothetical protein